MCMQIGIWLSFRFHTSTESFKRYIWNRVGCKCLVKYLCLNVKSCIGYRTARGILKNIYGWRDWAPFQSYVQINGNNWGQQYGTWRLFKEHCYMPHIIPCAETHKRTSNISLALTGVYYCMRFWDLVDFGILPKKDLPVSDANESAVSVKETLFEVQFIIYFHNFIFFNAYFLL